MGSKQQRAVLRGFLGQLDRDDRYTLMLHYVDQLTPREISMVLDRSYAWVMATLARLEDEVHLLMSSPPKRPAASAMRRDRHRLLSLD